MKKSSSDTFPQSKASQRGLSIIELLVSGAIVAVLGTLGAGAYNNISNKSALMREMSAAKTLITAYTNAAADRNGLFIRGLDMSAEEGELPNGQTIDKGVMARYPYRLAPYFDFKMEGVMVVNRSQEFIKKQSDPTYFTSLYPAFGINCDFVGGNYNYSGSMTNESECITRQSQMSSPIMAFVSASDEQANGERTGGYMRVEPPTNSAGGWGRNTSSWTASSSPRSFGYVDARHQNKAIAAFLDGSIRMLSIAELSDMRLWSKNAALNDDPNYVITPASGGGRPRR